MGIEIDIETIFVKSQHLPAVADTVCECTDANLIYIAKGQIAVAAGKPNANSQCDFTASAVADSTFSDDCILSGCSGWWLAPWTVHFYSIEMIIIHSSQYSI